MWIQRGETRDVVEVNRKNTSQSRWAEILCVDTKSQREETRDVVEVNRKNTSQSRWAEILCVDTKGRN